MSEHAISVTLKAGNDFSAPWVVLYGDNPEEVEFKLANIQGVLSAAVSAAAALRSLHTLEQGGVSTTPVPAEPSWAAGQQAQQQPAQTGGWGQRLQQTQQQAAPQGGSHPNAVLHPEGKACDLCGKPLEQKKTQNGKAKWQCPEWRWNNGNPNGHGMEWMN